MTDRCVTFFEDFVDCGLCGESTRGIVFENSGTINCDECNGIIFDARETGGTVVILELEDGMMQ